MSIKLEWPQVRKQGLDSGERKRRIQVIWSGKREKWKRGFNWNGGKKGGEWDQGVKHFPSAQGKCSSCCHQGARSLQQIKIITEKHSLPVCGGKATLGYPATRDTTTTPASQAQGTSQKSLRATGASVSSGKGRGASHVKWAVLGTVL